MIMGLTAAGLAGALLYSWARPEYKRGLIIGDSMLATPVFTQHLRNMTEASWENIARVGAPSAEIVRQLRASLANGGQYDVVVVSAGGNDMAGSLTATKQNLSRIVKMAHADGARVVLLTEPPFRSYARASQDAVRRSEASRRWVLLGGPGADHVVDLHSVLGDPQRPGHINPEYDSGDGLHPSRRGRELVARAVAHALR